VCINYEFITPKTYGIMKNPQKKMVVFKRKIIFPILHGSHEDRIHQETGIHL
jgi:hypothetical protein